MKCNEKCEVYSRVCGYFRPVANWNKGKKEEFKDRKTFKVTDVLPALFATAALFVLAGCASTAQSVTESASGKNLNVDGYVLLGEVETANPETGTPVGKLIIGRLTYKSRKVGIPADQKVPTTGYFKATKTRTLFGTEEHIVEYDFTAGSDADAKKALKLLEEKRQEALASEAETESAPPSQAEESTPAPQAASEP